MEIHRLSEASAFAVTSGADFFTMAKASFLFDADKSSNKLIAYVTETAEGQTIFADATAGTSLAVRNVSPSYYPVATFGAECGAIIEGLAWADSNLMKGYEYFVVDNDGAGTISYFVSGVLNSTQTQANDPFNSTTYPDFKEGKCWSSNYASGVNPFV